MTFKPKTAKDLPAGAEVYGRGITYIKGNPDYPICWTDSNGYRWTNATIDRLIADGAVITRVPVGTHTKEADRG